MAKAQGGINMRIVAALALVSLLTACGGYAAQDNLTMAQQNFVRASNDLDSTTVALFKHLKPSDVDECLSRANEISIRLYGQRNSVLASCLSAADKRNQGL
jgi:hypothetical protein